MKNTWVFAILFVGLLMGTAFAAGNGVSAAVKNAREQYKERVAEMKETYAQVRERYNATMKNWTNSRDAFRALPPNASGSALQPSKDYLNNLIDLMVSHINVVEEHVLNNSRLSDSDKNSIIAELESDASTLQSLKSEVDAAQTKAEVRAVAVKVRDEWKQSRVTIKKYAAFIVAANLESVIDKFELQVGNLNARVEALKSKGYDTSKVKSALTDAESKIADARAKIAQAKELFLSINSEDDLNTKFKEGRDLLNDARKSAVDAVKEVRSAIRETIQETNRGNNTAINNGKAGAPNQEQNVETNRETNTEMNKGQGNASEPNQEQNRETNQEGAPSSSAKNTK